MTETTAATAFSTAGLLTVLLVLGLVAAAAAVGHWWAQTRARREVIEHRDAQAAREAGWQAERGSLAQQVARLEGQLTAECSAHEATRADLEWQRRQNGELDKRILPMREALEQLRASVTATEKARVQDQGELTHKVGAMARQFLDATTDVKHEARKLSRVLSRSERRGAWGEMQLRRLVESAGMLPYVHYVEQDHSATDAGVLRPDMVIDLAGGRKVVVDSKAPLDAFLAMDEREDGMIPDEVLEQHAQAFAQHIRVLSSKEYWNRYDSPEFVIMFVPSEGLLSAALQVRPELLQTALDRRVMLASPTTLLSMLHAITHSWRQVEAAEQARHIQELGTELYKRLVVMAERVAKLGASLTSTVKAYDDTVATLEARVLPAGRKLERSAVGSKPLPPLAPLDTAARPLDPARWPAEPAGLAEGVEPAELALADADDEADADVASLADPQQLTPGKRRGRHSAA